MSALTWAGGARPPELVLGFGDLSEIRAIRRGIETVADLLRGP